jgi:hypothetical protein
MQPAKPYPGTFAIGGANAGYHHAHAIHGGNEHTDPADTPADEQPPERSSNTGSIGNANAHRRHPTVVHCHGVH